LQSSRFVIQGGVRSAYIKVLAQQRIEPMNETQTNAPYDARNAQMSVLTAMPEFYMRNLQRTSARMLRAQERVMQGLMQAGQLQMKFSQEFWASRGAADRTDMRQDASHVAVAETERVLSHLRDITATVQSGFKSALETLMDSAETTAQDAHDTSLTAAHAGIDAANQTVNRTGAAMRQGAEEIKNDANKATLAARPGAGT
jgi:membrane carboxypeptidase/penicillin-binding protein PbpC